MKYYVTADVHGYFTELKTALAEQGFFEDTEHYIFVHGWIPCTPISLSSTEKEYVPVPDWRNAGKEQWDKARWINGMEAAHAGIIESGKTIVCGHWHCSFGHAHYEHDGNEFEKMRDAINTAFEKVLGDLIYKPPGKPTLVPNSDKREAMNISDAKNEFKMED